MTTRNFRVNNGLEIGDIVISASANTIVGLATAAPSADGDVANKKYVDDQDAAIATDTLTLSNKTLTAPKFVDGGLIADANGNELLIFQTTASAVNQLDITNNATGSDPIISATGGDTNVGIAITAKGSGDIALNAGADVNIPVNIGLRFGDGGENIETDNTDLTVTSGGKINLATASDVHMANDRGIVFGDAGEKIEGDGTDLTITSSGLLNLSAGTDVVIPINIGLHFTDANEKIESNGTNLTITAASGVIALAPNTDVTLPNDKGLIFGDAGEKIEGDGTNLTISSSGLCTITATGNTAVTNNLTVGGNTTITGNLVVNGDTTTVSTTNTTIADNIIELNTGISASSNDAGIIIERGSTGNNAAILWDESADKFTMGTTTATAADKSGGVSVTIATLVANLEGAVTGNVTGDASGTALTVTQAAQTNITSVGTLTALQVDNLNLNGNTLSSTAGTDLLITPLAGQQIVLDATIVVDAGVVTGATSITSTAFVGNLTGTASAAQYSDVAERFASDSNYEEGTVVTLGGAEEITITTEEASDDVFGVVSSVEQAAFKMNSDAGSDSTHPYIAMTGRVWVKITGVVNKGDRLISSATPGHARAATKAECTAFNVLGRALEFSDTGRVKAAVRVSH